MNNIMEQLGFEKIASGKNILYSFDDLKDDSVKEELRLIQSSQLYNDVFAEEQLLAKFRGLINRLVNSSVALKTVGYDTCFQNAVSSVKAGIRNYDLSSYKRNKPSTYFTNCIVRNLDKLHKTETQGFAHISDALTGFKRNIYNAESILDASLGRKATSNEVFNFIKNDLGASGKGFTIKEVDKLMNGYNVREISSSREIDGSDGSESMTFEDLTQNDKTPLDLLEEQKKENLIIESINIFTKDSNKKEFLLDYFNLDKYKNIISNEKNITNLTQKHGISYHTAGKLLDGFKAHCINRGIL